MKKLLFIILVFLVSQGVKKLDAQILTVSPDTAEQGRELGIEVTAANIDFSQGTNLIHFWQRYFDFYSTEDSAINSSTLYISQIFNSNYPVGFYSFSIKNNLSGTEFLKDSAFYLGPDLTKATLDSISPNIAKQGDTVMITIYGTNTNFIPSKRVNSVYLINYFKTIGSASFTPLDSVTLQARFEFTYGHPGGKYALKIYDDYDGTIALTDSFELEKGPKAPAVLSVRPDTIILGQTIDVEVTAENIDFSQGTNVVSLKQENTEIFMNNSFAITNSSLIANITVAKNSPEGIYNLVVWNTAFDVTLLANQRLVKEKAFYLKSGADNIESYNEEKQLFYPNPANHFVYLKKKYELIQLYNLNGGLILESKQNDIVDVSAIPGGIYLLKISSGKRSYLQKLAIL